MNVFACGRGIGAAVPVAQGMCGAVCVRTLRAGCVVLCFCVCGVRGEARRRSLPPAPRFCSALRCFRKDRHCPQMPDGGAGVIFASPLIGSSYQGFGFCVRTHRGACSLFVHLHLNREWNPCPCRSSRYFGASFPFSPLPPLTRSPSPARAGEAEMAGYSLPPSLRGKWRAQRAERGALVFATSLPVPR